MLPYIAYMDPMGDVMLPSQVVTSSLDKKTPANFEGEMPRS